MGGWWGLSYQGDGDATITDFNQAEGDQFEITGSASDYFLESQSWSGSSALDTVLFNNGGDAIAIIQDTTDVFLELDFNFV